MTFRPLLFLQRSYIADVSQGSKCASIFNLVTTFTISYYCSYLKDKGIKMIKRDEKSFPQFSFTMMLSTK